MIFTRFTHLATLQNCRNWKQALLKTSWCDYVIMHMLSTSSPNFSRSFCLLSLLAFFSFFLRALSCWNSATRRVLFLTAVDLNSFSTAELDGRFSTPGIVYTAIGHVESLKSRVQWRKRRRSRRCRTKKAKLRLAFKRLLTRVIQLVWIEFWKLCEVKRAEIWQLVVRMEPLQPLVKSTGRNVVTIAEAARLWYGFQSF